MRKHLKATTLAERCRSYVDFYKPLESWIVRTERTCGENPIPENSIQGQALRGVLVLFEETLPRIQKLINQIEKERT